MRRSWPWSLVALVLLTGHFWLRDVPPAGAQPELLDRIVGVVDDQVILWSELNFRLILTLDQLGRSDFITPQEGEQLRRDILDQMIDEQVLLIKARHDSIAIDEGRVEELLGEQLGRIHAQLDNEEFEQMLSRSGLNERQLKTRYRKDIRHNLLREQIRNDLAFRLHITRKDLADYRDTYRDTLPDRIFVSRITLKIKADETRLSHVRQQIQEIEAKLDAGEAFEELALHYSEDTNTAADGGYLGCFSNGTLFPEFEEAAFLLKPGQISKPVLSTGGYHIIRLHEKRENELCASHIFLRAGRTEEDKQRTFQQLADLRRRVLSGEDFAELAQQHSEDSSTAKMGGLWQSWSKEEIPSFLDPYISHLKLGDITQPFFLEDGGHLLLINDDQNIIERMVREQRMASALRQLIDEFKHEIHIENRLNEDFLWQPANDTT
jgi:peptidyl-prolyl cis-trans isomerase SurA